MVILKRIGNRWDGDGNSRSLELLKAVTRSLEVKLRLKALDLAATLGSAKPLPRSSKLGNRATSTERERVPLRGGNPVPGLVLCRD